MGKFSDKELVDEAKKNLSGFTQLYKKYFGKVYGYCYKRFPNHAICEDVVSEVFHTIVEKIHTFDTSRKTSFASWVFTITHNQLIDYLRKEKKLQSFDTWVGEMKGGDDAADPEVQAGKDRKSYEVSYVLALLKPRYQKIISLRFYAEFEIEELSETFNISKQASSVLLHRALKSFEKKFKKNFPESEIFLQLSRNASKYGSP